MSHNQFTSRHTQDFWQSVGSQLAIGWLYPNINTLQDIVIYNCVPNVKMDAINTLGSVFARFFRYRLAIGWLSAGYQLATGWLMSQNQY